MKAAKSKPATKKKNKETPAHKGGSALFPKTHFGAWRGLNRLWFGGREPEYSDGTAQLDGRSLSYAWTFKGKGQEGLFRLFGPAAALRADWKDTMHANETMALHGFARDGVVYLYTTFSVGAGPEWGWQVEVDTRDPEHLVTRMFLCKPDGSVQPASDLRTERVSG